MKQSELKIVTDDTLKELRGLDIITPEIYTYAFESKLKQLDSNLDLNTVMANGVVQNIDKLFSIQNQTKESAQILKENIDLAATAIDKKDNTALKEVKNHMDILQQKILDLEGMVYIDELTKVYNRKWIYDKVLEDEKFTYDGILTFIDLDNFKSINDTYGHIAGDKILFLIANLLSKIENSEVARLGGDEFILISKYNTSSSIEHNLENINKSFESKSIKFQNETFKISISYGTTHFKKGNSFNEITEIVDQKMYETKREKKRKILTEA